MNVLIPRRRPSARSAWRMLRDRQYDEAAGEEEARVLRTDHDDRPAP